MMAATAEKVREREGGRKSNEKYCCINITQLVCGEDIIKGHLSHRDKWKCINED